MKKRAKKEAGVITTETVEINEKQIQRIAEILKNLPEEGKGLNFYSFQKDGKEVIASDMYPPLGHSQIVDFFFFGVMHDYGFWYGSEQGYLEPLYGEMSGKRCKGSELLWKMCMKKFESYPTRFEPVLLSDISPWEMTRIFSDDNGPVPWPDFETRFKMTRAYAKWFIKEKITPNMIVENANKTERPLHYFLTWVRLIPGYNRDRLEKKNLLLAMVLANRPEKFLNVKDPGNWKPLVDYHLIRFALRTGLVFLTDKEICEIIKKRQWIQPDIEREIRYAVFDAVSKIIEKSGRSMSFVDEKLWLSRRYCPEMFTPEMPQPDCPKCIFDTVCKKRFKMFQPVVRTTAY